MTQLLLLTAPNCRLCAHAGGVLDQLDVGWREVGSESDAGRSLAAAAPPLRPVLFTADGRVVAYGRLSLKRLRKQLRTDGPDTPRGMTVEPIAGMTAATPAVSAPPRAAAHAGSS